MNRLHQNFTPWVGGWMGLILAMLVTMCDRTSQAATHHVRIFDATYTPDHLAIGVGDTVIWANDDNTEHSVTSSEGDGALFDSGIIPPEESFGLEFMVEGVFDYYCTQHGRAMAGQIVVAKASENHPPFAPTNVLPAGNAVDQPVAVQLRATVFADSDLIDFHGASQWLVRNASTGAVVVDSGSVTSGSLIHYSPAGLAEGTAYEWQVRYRDGRGAWSEYSTPTRFTTLVSVSAQGVGLRASFYNTADFLAPLVVITNAMIDFNWDHARPQRRITADEFAVRWEGSLLPEFTQLYQIQFQFHGRARIWVNNKLLIDEWAGCGFSQTRRGAVSLVAGQLASVRVDYVADPAGAAATLRWSASTNLMLAPIPTARLFPHAP